MKLTEDQQRHLVWCAHAMADTDGHLLRYAGKTELVSGLQIANRTLAMFGVEGEFKPKPRATKRKKAATP